MRRVQVRRGRVVVARALLSSAVTLATIILAPVIVLVGEPVRRYYLRRLGRRPSRRRDLARAVIANRVLIALTAPGRWAMDRAGGLFPGRRGWRGFGRFGRRGARGDGDWPPPAEVREPRRPKPAAPAGAIALAEPRQQRRAVPMLKALPPALSEPARRVRSCLGQMPKALRARVGHWLSRVRVHRRRTLRASGS